MSDWEIDVELLERWRNDDLGAGQELFARHGDTVIRFFRNKVRSEVQDLVQETFMRIVAARDRIADGQAFRAYVIGVARRVLFEHLRTLERARRRERKLDFGVESIAALIPGPSTIAARRREQRLLLEGLRRIPIKHQILLELIYWEKLSAREIADILGVPHSTVRGRVKRARELLREAMAEIADSPALLESTTARLDDWADEVRLQHLQPSQDDSPAKSDSPSDEDG